MTQTTLELTTLATSNSSVSTPPIQLPTSCSNCPKFKDYQDVRGRGWCLLFNQVSFKKHPFTRDCELERVAEENIIRPLYTEGNKVKIIDSALDYTEWTTYIIVAKKFNSYRYKTPETALNQTDWYYQLATIKKLEVNPRWFAENDICHYEESANINPEGEF